MARKKGNHVRKFVDEMTGEFKQGIMQTLNDVLSTK